MNSLIDRWGSALHGYFQNEGWVTAAFFFFFFNALLVHNLTVTVNYFRLDGG